MNNLWEIALKNIKKEVSPQSYETWFLPIKQVSASEGTLTLEAPNVFFKTWLAEHYHDVIKKAISETAGREVDFQITTIQQAPDAEEQNKQKEKKGLGFLTKPFERFIQHETRFNTRYTFDEFVVGPSNRFAQAACMAVAQSPAKAYNPLFIYGGVGLGKTHLMQAIGQHALGSSGKLKVTYISSEKFTNQLISAIQNRSTLKFREKYRNQDVLLIDDIHFIAGKESTQEEFFHTFNTLYDSHKQIVISSDRPPKEIHGLEKRLVSRFEWGLVADIQPPDFETRVAILKKKSEKEVVAVPDDVIVYVAERIKANIRELEGALIRIVAYSSLIGGTINVDMAKEVLKEVVLEEKGDINIDLIQKNVSEFFNIAQSSMKTKKRTREFAFPRQIAMYLSREMTKCSFLEIGDKFGGRDHTTVIHAYEKIKKEVNNNKNTKQTTEQIVYNIKNAKQL
ncbi:MAG: chromosomal replication initiator protein DnaA [Candidatus Omnitrophica bacterium]|nr:chromosomal replication initiator protein DnaA [Candidatus Omnitrophota bacterium]